MSHCCDLDRCPTPEIPLRLLHAVLRARAAPDFAAAVATIRRRYPQAHYGVTWQPAPIGSSLPVWENAGVNLRYELGERDDDRKPVAYVTGRECGWMCRVVRWHVAVDEDGCGGLRVMARHI